MSELATTRGADKSGGMVFWRKSLILAAVSPTTDDRANRISGGRIILVQVLLRAFHLDLVAAAAAVGRAGGAAASRRRRRAAAVAAAGGAGGSRAPGGCREGGGLYKENTHISMWE